jgi:hypothetical protein
MIGDTGNVLKGVEDRLACLSLGYLIRAEIDLVSEAVYEEERREFNPAFIRPRGINDVQDTVKALIENLDLIGARSAGCGIPEETTDRWVVRLHRAANQGDDEGARKAIEEIERGFRDATAGRR